MNKECTKCHVVKLVSEFSKNAASKDRLQSKCKICSDKHRSDYVKTKIGLATKIYASQRGSSKNIGYSMPKYTKSQFNTWLFSQPNFEELYQNWVESGYDKMQSPSCDRLNDYAPYSFDNIRLVTWQENNKKSYSDAKNGINNKKSKSVYQHSKSGEFIAEHYSMSQAFRDTGVNIGCISACCNGKRNHGGGFVWSHKPDLCPIETLNLLNEMIEL